MRDLGGICIFLVHFLVVVIEIVIKRQLLRLTKVLDYELMLLPEEEVSILIVALRKSKLNGNLSQYFQIKCFFSDFKFGVGVFMGLLK